MKRIDWLQFIILPVAIAVMVVAWVAPWAQWIVLSTGVDRVGVAPPPALMLLVILVSMVVTRHALRQARYQRRQIVLGGLLAIMIVTALTYRLFAPAAFLRHLVDWQNSVAPELVVGLVTAALWWRGILVGRSQSLIDENLERTFLNGVLALSFLILVNHFSRRIAPLDMLAAVLIFFATALSTLTVVNIELARVQQSEAGSWLKRQRHWFATILAVVGAILLGGLFITGLFSPDTLRQFFSLIGPAFSTVANALVEVLRPLFTFFFWLISPLVPILQFFLRILLEGILAMLRVVHQIGLQINRGCSPAATPTKHVRASPRVNSCSGRSSGSCPSCAHVRRLRSACICLWTALIRVSPSAGYIKNFWNGTVSECVRARRTRPRWRMLKN